MSTLETLFDWARGYAEGLGWPVFPVVARGKVPLTPHGLNDATIDIDVIARWWARWPNANIGIATGPPGPTVIDADGPVGKHSWSTFIGGTGWETSPWSCTGGGGWHVYFRGDHDVNNRAGWLRKVDVRGVGGYVVAPPSIHASGSAYSWCAGPDERALQPLPEMLRDAITSRGPVHRHDKAVSRPKGDGTSYAQAALAGEIDKVRHAPVGTRNHTLCSAAFSLGQLVGTGTLDRDVVVQSLFDVGCAAGLTEVEVLRTTASGLRAGLENPRTRGVA